MVDVSEVEKKTDLVKARSIEIGTTLGGIVIQTVNDLEQISVRLARGLVAVPAHCRGEPGVVYALCMQALEWGMPIMSVINKSYVPRNGDRIGFESQLIHAVIEKNAPIKGRLRYEIMGNGDERRCKVWATFKGEDKPHEYISETLAKLHPGSVTKDGNKYVRGSQLWDTLPEVQMFYSASRQWARLFCPDVILGAYTPEDQFVEPIDVTPLPDKVAALSQRLKDAKLNEVRGFDNADVVRQVGAIIEGDVTEAGDGQGGSVSRGDIGGEGRQNKDRGSAADNRNEAASVEAGGSDKDVGAAAAADAAAKPAQADIFPPDRDEEKRKRKAKRK
jgi:hypothetical protein